MPIPKNATVIHVNGDSRRRGTVIREVDPHVVQGLGGETERTARYEVHWPEHGNYSEATQVHREDELDRHGSVGEADAVPRAAVPRVFLKLRALIAHEVVLRAGVPQRADARRRTDRAAEGRQPVGRRLLRSRDALHRDPAALERALGERTAAVVPVHLLRMAPRSAKYQLR